MRKFNYFGNNILADSDDGITWSELRHYIDYDFKNPSVVKYEGLNYIACDNGFYTTKDFINFEKLKITIEKRGYSDVKNFYLYLDDKGFLHVMYNATYNDAERTYTAIFDNKNKVFIDTFTAVEIPVGATSGLFEVNGEKYVWQAGDKLYKLSSKAQIATNIAGSKNNIRYSTLVTDDFVYVYAFNGSSITRRRANKDNLVIWTPPTLIKGIKGGQFTFNSLAETVVPKHDTSLKYSRVMKIKASDNKQIVPLTCFINSSVQVQWQKNNTYQIALTAYDDNSASFAMISEESEIIFNNQTFIIKQVINNSSNGVDTKDITASHIYSEISRIRQHNIKSGTLTYSVYDVLKFYLDDKSANTLGFTYGVYGDFPKQQIDNLGGDSGSDMLNKIISTWSNAIIYPDNKQITVYTPEAFAKKLGRRIDYLNNTSDVKLTVDTTSITNQVKCFGKTKENTSDNNVPTYYFDPFIVSNYESVNKWGVHPMDDINDERFTDKEAIKRYALGQMQPEPLISIETTNTQNEVPLPGEVRHLRAQSQGINTDVTVVGYTWYPYDESQPTQLNFANLPASILSTQSNINSRIRNAQLMAQKALDRTVTQTSTYVAYADPNLYNVVRTGDIWAKILKKPDDDSTYYPDKDGKPYGDDEKRSVEPSAISNDKSSNTNSNKTIYTDPSKIKKNELQFSIWVDGRWLEVANSLSTNMLYTQTKTNESVINAAKSEAAEAFKKAESAKVNLEGAMRTMDGKNAITYSTSKPTNSVEGDIWFEIQADGQYIQHIFHNGHFISPFQKVSDLVLAKIKEAKDGVKREADESVNALRLKIKAILQSIIDDANSHWAMVIGQINQNKTNYEAQKRELGTAKASLDKIKDEAKKQNKAVGDLKTEVDGLSGKYADLNGKASEFKLSIDGLKQQTQDNQGNIDTLKTTAEGLTNLVGTANDDISKLKQTAKSIETSVGGKLDSSIFMSFQTQTAAELSTKLTASDLTTYAKSADIKVTTDQISANIAQFDKKIADAVKNNGDVTKAVGDVNKTIEGIQTQLTAQNTQIGSINTANTTLNSSINTIKNGLKTNSDSITSFNTEIQALKDGLALKSSKTEIDALKDSIKKSEGAITTKLSTYERTLSDISKTNQGITSDISTLKNTSNQFSVDLSSTHATLSSLQESNADLSNAIDTSKARIEAVNDSMTSQIDLYVKKSNLKSEINLQPGKILLNADTVAFGENTKAFIPSAAISSLSADKITGTIINGQNATITNLTAGSITSGRLRGIDMDIVNNGTTISLDNRGIMVNNENSLTSITKVGINNIGADGKQVMIKDGGIYAEKGYINSAIISDISADKITGSIINVLNNSTDIMQIRPDSITLGRNGGTRSIITQRGIELINEHGNEAMGYIGTINDKDFDWMNGLSFNLDYPNGDFMVWSTQEKENDIYHSKLVWSRQSFGNYLKGFKFDDNVYFEDKIIFDGPIYGKGYEGHWREEDKDNWMPHIWIKADNDNQGVVIVNDNDCGIAIRNDGTVAIKANGGGWKASWK